MAGPGRSTRPSDETVRTGAPSEADAVDPMAAALVDAVSDYAIFRLDADGFVLTWNTGAQQIKGYTADEILGLHYSTFFDADDIAAGRPDRLLVAAAKNGRVLDEGWRVRKDGTKFWASVVLTALLGPGRELRGFVKIARDDTDRRAADAQAQQLELLRDREHLARELNDAVITKIFAAGLSLEAIRKMVDDPHLRQRVEDAVDELDGAIEALRTIMFHFQDDDLERPLPP